MVDWLGTRDPWNQLPRAKLPRLKLEELVAKVREKNAYKEITTGPAVGNEV